ncbi:MAG TPA: hypothetical protein VNJ53_13120 [Gaiellaceae bacterium]|nr:hypothetical protein [Gaiellaceae bacterium]
MPAVGSVARYAAVDVATSGDTTLVAAVAGKRLRVLAFLLVGAGAVVATFKSGAATALTGGLTLAASTVVAAPFSPEGWFETAAGEALVLNLSAAVSVDGAVVYQEVA